MTSISDIKISKIISPNLNLAVKIEIYLENNCKGSSITLLKSHALSQDEYSDFLSVVEHEIFSSLRGMDVFNQKNIDKIISNFKPSFSKENLDNRVSFSVSIALARAAAKCMNLDLYNYLGGLKANSTPRNLIKLIELNAETINLYKNKKDIIVYPEILCSLEHEDNSQNLLNFFKILIEEFNAFSIDFWKIKSFSDDSRIYFSKISQVLQKVKERTNHINLILNLKVDYSGLIDALFFNDHYKKLNSLVRKVLNIVNKEPFDNTLFDMHFLSVNCDINNVKDMESKVNFLSEFKRIINCLNWIEKKYNKLSIYLDFCIDQARSLSEIIYLMNIIEKAVNKNRVYLSFNSEDPILSDLSVSFCHEKILINSPLLNQSEILLVNRLIQIREKLGFYN